ncbi:radical SAM/SPASM domain-containing protein [Anaeromyxobacter oryzae]|uniref:Radical SAM/SPASM domain-containing protein n=1 Tax=Anaeromyxobacter oryzae TaxID=2918170 RepID=A0ABM7WS09_9BACT|nr:radical SAM protein [Anaeromyxobacter oryzae]BDG02244.1 radical SAM/SPASM domain-containing protein [Anaeromyxobacter oryzae]
MRLSRSTIVAPIPGTARALLVQPLSGQAAVVAAEDAAALAGLAGGGALPPALPEETLRAAAFVVDSEDEDRALEARARADWAMEAARTPTQLVVVPGFGCNLACTYCYQEPFDPAARALVAPEVIDAFFAYVDARHAADAPRPYVTLFGGEPLRDTPAHHDRIGRYLDGAARRGLEIAVVTNGFDLEAFLPALAAGPVKEVQVTLDGPRPVHDARRPHASGGGTFDRVVAGIEGLVAAGIPVNLRVVADRRNLPALPALAELAAAKGWLELPASRFKTQVGRNYELFGCASRQRREDLFDRVELWARYLELAEAHPILRRFHRPRFHGLGHLAETGELPAPNFDACPATKKEWAFGPDGSVYGCTATVGHPAHVLGRFHPEIVLDKAAIGAWRNRSTLTIPRCRACALAPVCGGGCGAIAWDQAATPLAPDCRPVVELYGIGARYHGLDT